MVGHEDCPPPGGSSSADSTAAFRTRQCCYRVLQEAVKCGHWQSGRICGLRVRLPCRRVAKRRGVHEPQNPGGSHEIPQTATNCSPVSFATSVRGAQRGKWGPPRKSRRKKRIQFGELLLQGG